VQTGVGWDKEELGSWWVQELVQERCHLVSLSGVCWVLRKEHPIAVLASSSLLGIRGLCHIWAIRMAWQEGDLSKSSPNQEPPEQ